MAGRVLLSNSIIAPSSWVPAFAINVPVGGQGLEPRKVNGGSVSLSRVIDAPGTMTQLASYSFNEEDSETYYTWYSAAET